MVMGKIAKKIIVVGGPEFNNYPRAFWEKPLKENCEKLIWFDLSDKYLDYGKDKTQKMLLCLFEKEKPDYVLMFDKMFFDLDILKILIKLKNTSPKTRTIFHVADDDISFNSSRYLALFFDYLFVLQNDFIPLYKREGIKNVFFIVQFDSYNLKPLKKKKRYDVLFMGAPKGDRKEIIEFLCKSGIDISLFGPPNWKNYPKLSKIYNSSVSTEDFPKVINQAKINICLSKNGEGVPHLKTRFFENSACRAFSLVEYCSQLQKLFKDGKEIIFFKTKEELVKKVRFYLENEKKRKKIEQASYKKVISKYSLEKVIRSFIKRTINEFPTFALPKLNYSIMNIDEKVMKLPKEEILKKIRNYDYLSFSRGQIIKSPFKEYLQIYSIKKNKKQISCCDYYVHSKYLGDYVLFRSRGGRRTSNQEKIPLFNINQIIMEKNFFIKNYNLIKKSIKEERMTFINDSNTTFIYLPLVSIFKFRKNFFKNKEFFKEDFFLFPFRRHLYAKRKNPIKLFLYLLGLSFEVLSGKRFLFYQLFGKFKKKNTKDLFFSRLR